MHASIVAAIIGGTALIFNGLCLVYFNARRENLVNAFRELLEDAVKEGITELHSVLDSQTRGYYFRQIVRDSIREVLDDREGRNR